MNKYKMPNLPLPAPLMGSEKGSFTELTITQRMPNIARRVIVENNFSLNINHALERLAVDLSSGYIPPLMDDTGKDSAAWQQYQEPYVGKPWLDVPWFFAETFFYRLILAITNYFIPGKWQGIDPFVLQKTQGLESSLDSIITLCQQVNRWQNDLKQENISSETGLIAFLYFSLWGNRVDLSLWSAFETDRSRFDIQSQQAHILVDNAIHVSSLLHRVKGGRVDFVLDNAGFELVCDLCLVDYLLASGLANEIQLHLKPHPTFVSDAMIKDLHQTIDFFAKSNNWDVNYFAQRLRGYLEQKRLILCEDYFWTSPSPFWEIPESLKNELSKANLLIIKGDANYRRLLGDLHWDFTTNIEDIICYLPVPTLALRTLKSEVAAGLNGETIAKIAKSDASWLTNGQWGVVQLLGK